VPWIESRASSSGTDGPQDAALTVDVANPEEIERVVSQAMDVNLRSVLLMSQTVGRHMIEQKWGRIVNLASVSAGLSFGLLNAYGPSKAGVANLTAILGHDLVKHGITVNAISPWFFKTSMTEAALETEAFRDFSTSLRHVK
jgi:NAD(P)-dependent dehydrogenase (short-subunit alcohol dehydrogenase family)